MNEHSPADCPPQILEWIAWYPDGNLTDAQRGAIEVHAADCASCRDEIAVLCERVDAAVAPADPEQLFERVLARIETNALGASSGSSSGASSGSSSGAGAPGSVPARDTAVPAQRAPTLRRKHLSWQRRSAIAAAGVALVALAGALGWLGRDWVSPIENAGAAIYRTASEATPTAVGGGPALDVVFRSEASAERINTALRGLGAVVTAGPTELGRYRIALPPGSDTRAAAALLRAEGSGVASYAEPARP